MATPWHYAQIEDQRNEVFARVQRVFRWTTAAAVAATVVIVGVVAHEIPGRSSVANADAEWPAGVDDRPRRRDPSPLAPGPSAAVRSRHRCPLPTPTQRTPTAVSGGTGW